MGQRAVPQKPNNSKAPEVTLRVDRAALIQTAGVFEGNFYKTGCRLSIDGRCDVKGCCAYF